MRIPAFFLTGLMVFALAGCAPKSDEVGEETPSDSADSVVELEVVEPAPTEATTTVELEIVDSDGVLTE